MMPLNVLAMPAGPDVSSVTRQRHVQTVGGEETNAIPQRPLHSCQGPEHQLPRSTRRDSIPWRTSLPPLRRFSDNSKT